MHINATIIPYPSADLAPPPAEGSRFSRTLVRGGIACERQLDIAVAATAYSVAGAS
jgi:hypothetical protein